MTHDHTLTALMDRLDRLERENAELRARTTALEAEHRSTHPDISPAPAPPAPPPDGAPLGRRALLARGAAAAGVAAAGAVLLDGSPAAAVDGSPLILGNSVQNATVPTGIVVTGTSAGRGFSVLDNGTSRASAKSAIVAHARGLAFTSGLEVIAESNAGVFVNQYTSTGVGVQVNMPSGSTGNAILVNGAGGPALRATGTSTVVNLESSASGAVLTSRATESGVGVYGVADKNGGRGVRGTAFDGIGVEGLSNIASGVRGQGATGVTAAGTATGLAATAQTGFAVDASSNAGTGLKARGAVFGVIAQTTATSPDLAALAASALGAMAIDASTDDGRVMLGRSTNGGGIEVRAPQYHLRLANAQARPAPTGDTTAHQRGDIVEASSGDLWLCTTAGTPGTWRKLAGPTTAGAFHVLATPARVYDSRPGLAPTGVGPKTPMPGGTAARTIDLRANASGVPAGAIAAMVSILVVGATSGAGNATIWAAGAAKPVANTMVWGGTGGRASTLAVTALDALARAQINSSIRTDVVIDVVGYYR